MQKFVEFLVGFIALFVLAVFLLCADVQHFEYRLHRSRIKSVIENSKFSNLSEFEEIVIAATICGNQDHINLAFTMIKSAILFRGNLHIRFLIVCTPNIRENIKNELDLLNGKAGNVFTYELRDPYFPKENATFWHYWYAECATARLFLPNIFPDVGKMIYVDTDTVFLNNLSDLWQHACKMNESQMIASGPDYLDLPLMAKLKNSKYPLNLAPSLNDGVLILDTKKMVKFGWYRYILKMAEIYSAITPFPDQDLIRLMVMFHADKLYPLSCKYNFHTYTCSSEVRCVDVETQGVTVLHGCSAGYKTNPEFKAIWSVFQEFRIGVDSKTHLIELFKKTFEGMKNKLCGMSTNALFNNINKTISTA